MFIIVVKWDLCWRLADAQASAKAFNAYLKSITSCCGACLCSEEPVKKGYNLYLKRVYNENFYLYFFHVSNPSVPWQTCYKLFSNSVRFCRDIRIFKTFRVWMTPDSAPSCTHRGVMKTKFLKKLRGVGIETLISSTSLFNHCRDLLC